MDVPVETMARRSGRAVVAPSLACSIGRNQREVWRAICESRAGIGKLTRFPNETFPTDLAAQVDAEIDGMLPVSRRVAKIGRAHV